MTTKGIQYTNEAMVVPLMGQHVVTIITALAQTGVEAFEQSAMHYADGNISSAYAHITGAKSCLDGVMFLAPHFDHFASHISKVAEDKTYLQEVRLMSEKVRQVMPEVEAFHALLNSQKEKNHD